MREGGSREAAGGMAAEWQDAGRVHARRMLKMNVSQTRGQAAGILTHQNGIEEPEGWRQEWCARVAGVVMSCRSRCDGKPRRQLRAVIKAGDSR